MKSIGARKPFCLASRTILRVDSTVTPFFNATYNKLACISGEVEFYLPYSTSELLDRRRLGL
jgi:hypothetical protein